MYKGGTVKKIVQLRIDWKMKRWKKTRCGKVRIQRKKLKEDKKEERRNIRVS